MNNLYILAVGFVVHAIFVYAVYDVYFTSKTVNGMTPHRSSVIPAARRLVLFSLDGVRASSVFQLDDNGKSYFPFLRKVVETKGAWGINDNVGTTYTQEGHIAMLSGFYQGMIQEVHRRYDYGDPFDSVFNESRRVFALAHGSLFPIFDMQEIEKVPDVDCFQYVYNCSKLLFEKARANTDLKRQLAEDQIVFFIQNHYTDAVGPNINPASIKFKQSMPEVDEHMRLFSEMVEKYYGDDRTVFALTSGHGQGEQADDGTSALLERHLPLIVWGAGVRGPLQSEHGNLYPDMFSEEWKLQHIRRHDIQMIDMAPLLAALLGVNFPMNSEVSRAPEQGILPHELLNCRIDEKAQIMYAHIKQLIAQMERKMEIAKEHALKVTFIYYSELSPQGVHAFYHQINSLLSENQFQRVVDECAKVAPIVVNGIRYYQAYGRFFLRSVLLLGFTGWIVYLLTLSTDENNDSKRPGKRFQMLALAVIGVTFSYIYALSLSWTVYIYCTITIGIWMLVYLRTNARIWTSIAAYLVRSNKIPMLCYIEWLVLVMIIVYGCTYRYLLTFGFMIVGVGPLWLNGIQDDKRLKLTWLVLCIVMSIFPNLPTIMFPPADMNRSYLLVSGIFMCLSGLAFIWYTVRWKTEASHMRSNIINIIQIVALAVAAYIAGTTLYVSRMRINYVVSTVHYTICWTIMACTPLWPLLDDGDIKRQLCTVLLSLFTIAILVSKSWESMYFMCLVWLMITWYCLETSPAGGSGEDGDSMNEESMEGGQTTNDDKARVHKQLLNIRRVVYAIFFGFASIFGRDTIMSLSGITRSGATLCLTTDATTNQGFYINGLQVAVPAVFVICAIHAISYKIKFSSQQLLCTAYVICDIMSMILLFMFYDVDHRLGWASSWIHYTLAALGVTVGALLLGAVRVLMRTSPMKTDRGATT